MDHACTIILSREIWQTNYNPRMAKLWNYVLSHWGISLCSWLFGNVTGGVFIWVYPNRNAWKQERREKKEQKIDSRILIAMADPALWKGPRPMTGAGIRPVKSDEMAEFLELTQEQVADSFERLEEHGRVTRGKGSMDDPSPWWYIIPR